jgi:NPCBM/NEW2 domain
VWILFSALILTTTTATDADVTAKKLNGDTIAGTLQSWQNGQLVLVTQAGPQPVTEADLLLLKHSSPAASNTAADVRKPLVELVDGTTIPLAEFSIVGTQATLVPRLRTQNAPQELQQLSLQVKKVKSVRLQPMSEAVIKQWEEIVASATSSDSPTPSDLLVVFKRGGQSLDYLEGIIGRVTDRDVEFTHDGSTVRVSRDKVAGLIFYRATPPSDETARCLLKGADELSIRADNNIRLDGDELQITSSAGLVMRCPWTEILSADFSAGKLLFLSDLLPVSQSWKPLVALPAAAAHSAAFGEPRFDRAAVGGSLSLWYPDSDQSLAKGHAESFAKGIAIRSRTEIIYRLPGRFTRFCAVAGIEPATRSSGDVVLTILGDDRPLLERPVTGQDVPFPIELDVASVKQLKVVVDYGKNLDIGDWLNLCNARLVK